MTWGRLARLGVELGASLSSPPVTVAPPSALIRFARCDLLHNRRAQRAPLLILSRQSTATRNIPYARYLPPQQALNKRHSWGRCTLPLPPLVACGCNAWNSVAGGRRVSATGDEHDRQARHSNLAAAAACTGPGVAPRRASTSTCGFLRRHVFRERGVERGERRMIAAMANLRSHRLPGDICTAACTTTPLLFRRCVSVDATTRVRTRLLPTWRCLAAYTFTRDNSYRLVAIHYRRRTARLFCDTLQLRFTTIPTTTTPTTTIPHHRVDSPSNYSVATACLLPGGLQHYWSGRGRDLLPLYLPSI